MDFKKEIANTARIASLKNMSLFSVRQVHSLLIRCSPEVRIMSSGSGKSAVCKYPSMVLGKICSGVKSSFIMERMASTISHFAL